MTEGANGAPGPVGPTDLSPLLPPGAVAVVASPEMWEAPLHPEEAALAARAVTKRRREFAAGRAAARCALGHLGFPDGPLTQNTDRSPAWPEGALGSITHCQGFCAAVAARSGTMAGLGIDAEPDEPLSADVAGLVISRRERAMAAGLRGPVNWDKLIFSAKESVFKALNPLTGVFLEFRDAEIAVDPGSGRFDVALLSRSLAVGGRRLCGRFLIDRGIIVTLLTAA